MPPRMMLKSNLNRIERVIQTQYLCKGNLLKSNLNRIESCSPSGSLEASASWLKSNLNRIERKNMKSAKISCYR